MRNTIEQLYMGKIEPRNVLGNGNIELRRIEILRENNHNKLKDSLDENTKIILEKYNECIDEYIFTISEQSFCDGFCLGMRILSEAIGGAERIL
ncbi:MAG: hypothetical protein IJB72_05540 [Clostridia bacterium]|nr:hypothetical protein [Clostridia bacterium]